MPKPKPTRGRIDPDSGADTPHADLGAADEQKMRARQRLKCSNCGFVQSGTAAERACPACGAESLRPYEERLSPGRARKIGLRLHPMATHAPPAFAATLLALSAGIALTGEDPVRTAFLDTARVLSALLPFSIAVAILTGLADAKLRLKTRTTPLLVRKIVAGTLFFALSFAAAALALFTDFGEATLIPYAILMALCSVAAAYLGRSGSSLRDVAVPD